jgi:hypothetical protein
MNFIVKLWVYIYAACHDGRLHVYVAKLITCEAIMLYSYYIYPHMSFGPKLSLGPIVVACMHIYIILVCRLPSYDSEHLPTCNFHNGSTAT